MTPPPDVLRTWEAALAARANAHCPYSGYAVGAALRLADGRVFGGCNVENASYGATICAERVALHAAVCAAGPGLSPAHLVLVTRDPAPPCGLCLQSLSEFAPPDMPVWLTSPAGDFRCIPFSSLLPHRFDPSSLEPPHA